MANEVQSGRLRKRLTLLAPPLVSEVPIDTHGQAQPTYSEQGKVWGEVQALTGRDFWQAQQSDTVFSHRVEVRYASVTLRIAENWRIAFEGKTLNVQVPPRDVDGRRQKLEILCLEVSVP